AGRYVILGAFENDNLVRDPDLNIGGTSTLHVEIMPGQTTTADSFKGTGALDVLSPGADGPEQGTGAPTFEWDGASPEAPYDLIVFDAFGNVVWETDEPSHSGDNPMVLYGGPALEAGMYYQFRATSYHNGTAISATEDLRGVFFLAQ